MSQSLERFLFWTTTLSVISVTCVVVAARLNVGPMAPAAAEPVFVEGWEAVEAYGTQVGSSDAAVQLIEFVDFQCPYCQEYHEAVIKPLTTRGAADIGVTYVHFPLAQHPLARPLAQGAECTGHPSRFSAYVDAVFSRRIYSIDEDVLSQLGSDASVPDLDQFVACAQSNAEARTRVEAAKQFGLSMGVVGTPTIWVNGWQLPAPPTAEELEQVLLELEVGREPSS